MTLKMGLQVILTLLIISLLSQYLHLKVSKSAHPMQTYCLLLLLGHVPMPFQVWSRGKNFSASTHTPQAVSLNNLECHLHLTQAPYNARTATEKAKMYHFNSTQINLRARSMIYFIILIPCLLLCLNYMPWLIKHLLGTSHCAKYFAYTI